MNLKEKIRTIPDFPKQGVLFRDITTLLLDPSAFRSACDTFYDRYKSMDINKVVSIDARGFMFGAVLAYKLNVGFVPIRKKGKLPAKTVRKSYSLEYGQDTLEMHADAIAKGERVLIVDDLIATGGTISAAIQLVEELGGNVIECAFLVELPDLHGRKKLNGYNIFSLTEFDGD